jgi:hypothetical protein
MYYATSNQGHRARLRWHCYASGWPLLAGLAEERSEAVINFDIAATVARERSAYTLPRWMPLEAGKRDTLLPATPLWPGFALDTAFYGTIVFMLWSTPSVIRRRADRNRKRRGRCPACGYDLRGAPAGPCPECGS